MVISLMLALSSKILTQHRAIDGPNDRGIAVQMSSSLLRGKHKLFSSVF